MLAAKIPSAGGERFIVNYDKFYWQDIGTHNGCFARQEGDADYALVDAANDIDHSIPVKGEYGATKNKEVSATFPRAKSERILGLKYTGLHECIRDSLTYFKEFPRRDGVFDKKLKL